MFQKKILFLILFGFFAQNMFLLAIPLKKVSIEKRKKFRCNSDLTFQFDISDEIIQQYIDNNNSVFWLNLKQIYKYNPDLATACAKKLVQFDVRKNVRDKERLEILKELNLFYDEKDYVRLKNGEKNLVGVNLAGVDFTDFDLSNVDFTDANLVGSIFGRGTDLKGVIFKNTDLSYAVMDEVCFSGNDDNENFGQYENVQFVGTKFIEVDFRCLKLKNINFRDAMFISKSGSSSNLFSDCKLKNLCMENVLFDIFNIGFTSFVNVNMKDSIFKKLILNTCRAPNGGFKNINFEGVEFYGCYFLGNNKIIESSNFKNVKFMISCFSHLVFKDCVGFEDVVSAPGLILDHVMFKDEKESEENIKKDLRQKGAVITSSICDGSTSESATMLYERNFEYLKNISNKFLF